MTVFNKKSIPAFEVLISNEDRALRAVSNSENSKTDYLDDEIRRIFPINGKHDYENLIFEELVALCLIDSPISIEIRNCEFKKGVFIRSNKITSTDYDYELYFYKCDVLKEFTISSFDAKNGISIDNCTIETLNITDKSRRIDFYGSKINLLSIENERCESFNVTKSKIEKYYFNGFIPNEVKFDTDNLAIHDYERFEKSRSQTQRQISEQYHRIVLKTSKSIKSTREINYELTKATSNEAIGLFFGYFYRPLYVIFCMTVIILLFSVVYSISWNLNYGKSLYFSVYTFLTIGFGDIDDNNISLFKTLLVFIEGMSGILYSAVLLTSIINSSKK